MAPSYTLSFDCISSPLGCLLCVWKKCSMLYTVRLNAAELASARGDEKMDMEDVQPNLALILQSLFVPLRLLPVKWTFSPFCGHFAWPGWWYYALNRHRFQVGFWECYWQDIPPLGKPEHLLTWRQCLPNLVMSKLIMGFTTPCLAQ